MQDFGKNTCNLSAAFIELNVCIANKNGLFNKCAMLIWTA